MRKLIVPSETLNMGSDGGDLAGYIYQAKHCIFSGWQQIAGAIASANRLIQMEELFSPVSDDNLKRIVKIKEKYLSPTKRIYHPIMVSGFEDYEVTRPTMERYNMVIQALVGKFESFKGLRLYDLCCHHAYWAFSLEASGFNVTAIDNDTNALYVARHIREIVLSDIGLIEADIWDFVGQGLSSDIILFMNSLHHIVKDKTEKETEEFLESLAAMTNQAAVVSYRQKDLGCFANPLNWPGWDKIDFVGIPNEGYPIWICSK